MNNIIPGINWIKTCIGDLRELVRVILHGYPLESIEYIFLRLITTIIIYPITMFVLGKRKGNLLCGDFLRRILPKGVLLPLPTPLRSKVQLKESLDGYFNIYRDDECRRDLIKKGMNVVDVGAYIGLYTIMAAEKVGRNGKVIAIEPDPRNFEQLIKNLKLNNLQNVIPLKMALADYTGFAKLFLGQHGSVSSLLGKGDFETVQVTTLDNLLEQMVMEKIDIVKIDVEGAELSVLKDAEKTINKNKNFGIKFIVDSYHYPAEIDEVCLFFKERGFKTEVSSAGIVFAAPN